MALAFIVTLCGCGDTRPTAPLAKDGILDLSQWDFQKHGSVPLQGEWRIAWSKFTGPMTASDFRSLHKSTIDVPGKWETQNNPTATTMNLPGQGFATYSLLIDLPTHRDRQNLGLHTSYLNSAAKWRVLAAETGEVLASMQQGVAAQTKDGEVPVWVHSSTPVPTSNTNQVMIIAHLSNFSIAKGGTWTAPTLGHHNTITAASNRKLLTYAGTLGVFLMIGLYHLIVFAQRRENKSPLYFALFCMTFSLRPLMSGNLIQESGFGQSPEGFEWLLKINIISMPLMLAGCCMFVSDLIGDSFLRRFKAFWCFGLGGILILFTLATSAITYSVYLPLYTVHVFIGFVCIFAFLIQKAKAGNKKAFWTCMAFLLLIVGGGINAILRAHGVSQGAIGAGHIWVAFILIQSFILSGSSARAHRRAEHLSQHLQQEVDAKTVDLSLKTQEAEQAREEAEQLRQLAEEHADEVEILDRQKTHFFQNISHELRTPLTLILNPLEQAAETAPDNKLVDVALRNARRLTRLVNQLLDFQKLSAGKQELKLEPVNVVQFGRICGDYFASACSTKNIVFTTSFNSTPVTKDSSIPSYIQANVDALEKIVFNFLSNALKYTPEEGQISLDITDSQKFIRVNVRDTGPGIPIESQSRLFEIFSQVDDSTTREFEGTGLGLALSKELAEKMSGQVGVDSKPGTGSTFWVEFPSAEAPDVSREESFAVKDWVLTPVARNPEQEATELEGNEDFSGHTILVVDDLLDMRNLIAATLSDKGYKVVTASNGVEGLQRARSEVPRLIITDWMMPEMSGPEFIESIRSDASLDGIPTVLLTAKSDEESKLKGKDIGADAFLGKPFNSQELLSTVRNLIQLKETSERELRHAKNLLTQSEKLSQLGGMIASIGHEISNPIMLVGMASENIEFAIQELEDKIGPVFTGSKEAEQFGQILNGLIEELRSANEIGGTGGKRLKELSMALRTQSRMEVEATPGVSINEVVRECMVLVGGRTKLHQIEESYGELPPVRCFRSKVGQVITNILSNAADALNEKAEEARQGSESRFSGKIRVESQTKSRAGSEWVLVSISDNGNGVPSEIREKIFEQFFTTKAAGLGTGLGLSLCASIIAEHGGELIVTDDMALGGARFEMWLPASGS